MGHLNYDFPNFHPWSSSCLRRSNACDREIDPKFEENAWVWDQTSKQSNFLKQIVIRSSSLGRDGMVRKGVDRSAPCYGRHLCLIPIPSIWLSCARQLPHVPAALESKSPSRNYDNWRRRVWGAACDTGGRPGGTCGSLAPATSPSLSPVQAGSRHPGDLNPSPSPSSCWKAVHDSVIDPPAPAETKCSISAGSTI